MIVSIYSFINITSQLIRIELEFRLNSIRTCILRGVIHSCHPRWLLRAGTLLQAVINQWRQWILHIWLKDIGINAVIDWKISSLLNSRYRIYGNVRGLVRYHRSITQIIYYQLFCIDWVGQRYYQEFNAIFIIYLPEFIIVQLAVIKFKSGIQDSISNLCSVAKLRWQPSNIWSNWHNLVLEQPWKRWYWSVAIS